MLKYSKDIKGLKYIIITLLVLFWIGYVMPSLLLRIPLIQQKVAQAATQELSERLRVPVRIGNVNIRWFNRLVLEDLYLEAPSGTPLFNANHVSAGFDVLPLLHGRLVFSTVRLFGFTLHLSKESPQSPLNLQFLIDAFARKDSTKAQPDIDFRFNSILIRRGNFRYDVQSANPTPEKFNAQHVDLRNLSATISIKALNKDSLNAFVKKMSFDEASGFTLNKLSFNVVANRDSAVIQNFSVKLPETDFKLEHACLHPADTGGLAGFLDHSPVELQIAPSQVCLKDLSAFVPAFRHFTETIELSAEASGYINNINLRQLILKYSDRMLFVGKMNLRGITHPQDAYLFGQVNKLYLTTEGISGLANNFNRRPVVLPAPLVKLGTINFTGEISGFFDNLVAYGKFSSAIGSLQTDLVFGRNPDKNMDMFLKGHLSTSDLQINELFPEGNPYGTTRLDVKLDAYRPRNGSFSGTAMAENGCFIAFFSYFTCNSAWGSVYFPPWETPRYICICRNRGCGMKAFYTQKVTLRTSTVIPPGS